APDAEMPASTESSDAESPEPVPQPLEVAVKVPEPTVPESVEPVRPARASAERTSLRHAADAVLSVWGEPGGAPSVQETGLDGLRTAAAGRGLALAVLTPTVAQLQAINLPAIVRIRTGAGTRF